MVVGKGIEEMVISCYFMIKRGLSLDILMQSKKLALIKFEVTFGEVFSGCLSLIIQFDFMLGLRFVKSF